MKCVNLSDIPDLEAYEVMVNKILDISQNEISLVTVYWAFKTEKCYYFIEEMVQTRSGRPTMDLYQKLKTEG